MNMNMTKLQLPFGGIEADCVMQSGVSHVPQHMELAFRVMPTTVKVTWGSPEGVKRFDTPTPRGETGLFISAIPGSNSHDRAEATDTDYDPVELRGGRARRCEARRLGEKDRNGPSHEVLLSLA